MKNVILTSTLLLITSFLFAQFPSHTLSERHQGFIPSHNSDLIVGTDGYYYTPTLADKQYSLLKVDKNMKIVNHKTLPIDYKEEEVHATLQTTAGYYIITQPTYKMRKKHKQLLFSHIKVNNGKLSSKKEIIKYDLAKKKTPIFTVVTAPNVPLSNIHNQFIQSTDKSKTLFTFKTTEGDKTYKLIVFNEIFKKLYTKDIKLKHEYKTEVIEKATISNDGSKIHLLVRAQKNSNAKFSEYQLYTITKSKTTVTPLKFSNENVIHAAHIYYDEDNNSLAIGGLYGPSLMKPVEGLFFTTKAKLKKGSATFNTSTFSHEQIANIKNQNPSGLKLLKNHERTYQINHFSKRPNGGFNIVAQYRRNTVVSRQGSTTYYYHYGPILVASLSGKGDLMSTYISSRNITELVNRVGATTNIIDNKLYILYSSNPTKKDISKYDMTRGFQKRLTKLVVVSPKGEIAEHLLFDNKEDIKHPFATTLTHITDKDFILGGSDQKPKRKRHSYFLSIPLSELK